MDPQLPFAEAHPDPVGQDNRELNDLRSIETCYLFWSVSGLSPPPFKPQRLRLDEINPVLGFVGQAHRRVELEFHVATIG